jgi:hypothetical protein
MVPDRGLATEQNSGVKGKKVRLTYAFTINADGSEKLPAFVIGKAKQPRCFRKKTGQQLGFLYRNNAKAWMTSPLYQEWLRDWDTRLKLTRRHILLFQDNFKGHIVPDDLECIRVINFAPNLTPHVQPADAGIIRCFKAHYRTHYIHRAINRYDSGVTPSQIYDIDQLTAMRLAETAWDEVSAETIYNCWLKARILPSSLVESSRTDLQHPPPALSDVEFTVEADKEVSQALDNLQERGVLQKSNRMDIDDFVEPADEDGMEGGNEGKEVQDIYDAVMEAAEAREMMEINGGDDVDPSKSTPPPTTAEVLRAAETVKAYISDINVPSARQLEGLLGTLSREARREQSQKLRETKIIDYFKPR